MRVTLLGTGTSHGVPAIACDCAVCRSTDVHDRRMRPSILLDLGDVSSRDTMTSSAAAAFADRGGGPIRAGRHRHRSARAGARLQRPSRRRDSVHPQPRRSRHGPRRSPSIQHGAADGDRLLRGSTDAERSAADVLVHLRHWSATRRRAFRGCRCSRLAVRSRWAASRSSRCPLMHGPRPILGYRVGIVRLSDRLQPHPGSVVAAARRRRHARARRASRSAALDAFLAWTKRCRSSSVSGPHAPTSRISATICRTPRPARGSRLVWSWPMMGWSWRSREKVKLGHFEFFSFLMDIIHFPDDPRPRHWTRPVLALGNFDGLHRGHRKILDRVSRVAGEHGATARGDDLRPASAARGAARQGAAAADDQGAETRRIRGDRPAGRGDRSLHRRAVALGSGDVRQDGAGRLAARLGSLGRRQFSLRPRSDAAISRCCAASARATASGPRRSIPSATRISSSAARASAACSARAVWTRPGRCSATSTTSKATSCTATSGAGPSAFPRPTCAPRTSCCRPTACTRRR